jgi:hypothetical protein
MRSAIQKTWWLAVGLALTALITGTPEARAQDVLGHSVERSDDAARLILDLSNGDALTISLEDGAVLINGSMVGTYHEGGEFEQSWRDALEEMGAEDTGTLLAALQSLEVSELRQSEIEGIAAVATVLEGLEDTGYAGTGENITISIGDADVDAEIGAAVEAAVAAAVAAAEGAGVTISGFEDTKAVAPQVTVVTPATHLAPTAGSLVGGIAAGTLSLLATFFGLAFMGLGLIFFAPRQLETVADTVWHSFWRSFLAGLFAQPLVLPAFGMMIVGLALTVVGIVVIPFAIVAFAAALVLAAISGYVAVARTIGEIYLRRKMARGESVATWGSFRYIVYGLTGLMAIWLPAVVLGGVPVAGNIATITAGVTTWMLATAGFGATILSRAGVRGTFVRRLDMALTDEQFWTPEAMPVRSRESVRGR